MQRQDSSSSSDDEEYTQRKQAYLEQFRGQLRKHLGAAVSDLVDDEIRKSQIEPAPEKQEEAKCDESLPDVVLEASLTSDKSRFDSWADKNAHASGVLNKVGNWLQATINKSQIKRLFPYSKCASILDPEPDKVLTILPQDPIQKVEWSIKNKSNEAWPV